MNNFFIFFLQWGFKHVFKSEGSYDYYMKGMEWKDTRFRFWNREFRNWIACSEVSRLTVIPLTVDRGASHGQPWFNCGSNRHSKIKQENSRTYNQETQTCVLAAMELTVVHSQSTVKLTVEPCFTQLIYRPSSLTWKGTLWYPQWFWYSRRS